MSCDDIIVAPENAGAAFAEFPANSSISADKWITLVYGLIFLRCILQKPLKEKSLITSSPCIQ